MFCGFGIVLTKEDVLERFHSDNDIHIAGKIYGEFSEDVKISRTYVAQLDKDYFFIGDLEKVKSYYWDGIKPQENFVLTSLGYSTQDYKVVCFRSDSDKISDCTQCAFDIWKEDTGGNDSGGNDSDE